MKIKDIKELIKAVAEHEICELDLEMDNIKLKLVNGKTSRLSTQLNPLEPEIVHQQSVATILPSQDETSRDNVYEICSPMVGTFYRAPSPTSQPFVEEDGIIREGQTLCIIEAMKLMNEIESEVEGKILEILVENGQPVEYGQPLFLIELSN